ncbi:MAG: hypothetical protein LBC41_11075, partial [Clostridiales bacterium]|nr:hypothetical protein [Clostridiales bacterium]
MDRNDIRAKLAEFEGRPGEIAQVVLKMDGAQWDEYNNAVRELCELLMKNSPKTLEAMFDDGPRQIFEAIHGAEVAQWVGQACGRLNFYVHSPSTYRRSFRTADVELYLRRFSSFVEKVFFFWDQCDMLKELTAPAAETREMANKLSHIYGDLLAVRIDNGEERIIEAVKEIMLGDNNTQLLSHDIVNGIIKSGNKELHSMLGSMLLAAKLQEGLRQTILENADNGRVEAFADLMKIVLDNDLLRYSSAIRAIDVWMGMPYEYDDKIVSSKMLTLGYEFLTGARSASEAMNSLDTTEIYAALWASSVREMNTAKTLIEQLIKGKKHQVLTGLHFLRQLENESLQSEIASRFLRDTDLDILSSALGNYLTTYIRSIANGFEEDCRSYKVLADDERRSWQFDAIIDIIPLVPTSGYTSSGNPFAWCTLSITPQILFTRLLIIAGYDRDAEKVSRLIDVMAKADSESRLQFLKLFLEEPKNEKERAFVFASLNDKSMSARTQALKNITVFSRHSVLTESEEKAATSLLGLKTGDIRQNVINLLHGLPGDRPKAAAKALLSDKTENKRLAGLDMLTRFVQKDGMPKSEAFELCSLMPKVTDREQLLIDTFVDNKTEYCAANGFGLYDPNYYPDLPFPERSSKHTAKSVFFGDMDKLNAAFDDLCNLIRENKDYTYLAEYYSGNEEVALGALSTVKFRAELEDKELPFLDKFVLPEVWRGWKERNQADTGLLLKLHLLFSLKPYAYSDNAPWVEELLGKFLPIKVSEEFVDSTRKRDYGNLAWSIINCFYEECPKEERFELVYAGFAEMLELISEEDWKRNCGGSRRYFNSDDFTDTLQDNRDIEFLIEELSRTAASDEHFKKFVPICFVLGRYAGLFYANLDAVEVARAVDLGILKVDALYRTMFLSNPRYASDFSGNIREYQKKNV